MQAPRRTLHRGRWISLDPLAAERDAADLYAASHGSEEKEAIGATGNGSAEEEKGQEKGTKVGARHCFHASRFLLHAILRPLMDGAGRSGPFSTRVPGSPKLCLSTQGKHTHDCFQIHNVWIGR